MPVLVAAYHSWEAQHPPLPTPAILRDKPYDGSNPAFHEMSIASAPGNPHNYNYDDLRTYTDGRAHDHEPVMTTRRFMSLVALAFLWTNAQIPLYLYGGISPVIYGDIGGTTYWVWFITANLLSSAAVCPFVGALSDLLGRKHVAIIGCLAILTGQIICGTARTMNAFICGMAITGIGSGINELTALAGTAELAPTTKRGSYVALLILSVIPFLPSAMWSQLIATVNWRYVALLIWLWTFIGVVLIILFYSPPRRVNALGLRPIQIVRRIDFIGGFLSVLGIVVFIAGLLSGGYPYHWDNYRVLVPLILGIALMACFVAWEVRWARYPMFPRRLGRAPRSLLLTMLITFISGANFFSVLMLWPSQAYNVYGHDPVGVGIRGLPFAFGVLGGCVITLYLLTKWRGQIKWLLFTASCIMTAGCGALSSANRDNIGVVYIILLVAGLGVGGIVLPASIIATIISPDDLIATITALTLAIRGIGGAVGYAIYYNVFVAKLVPNLTSMIGYVCEQNGITDQAFIGQVIELTGASLVSQIQELPQVGDTLLQQLVAAGQLAYAESYPWVYYSSIAFGGISILVSLFLEDISRFMDGHVAVIIT